MPRIHKEQNRPAENVRLHRIASVWLVDAGNHGIQVNDVLRKKLMKETEGYAGKVILPEMGFTYVLPLNDSIKIWGQHKRRTRSKFPFDFYCEKDGQKWFIDVTAYIKKVLPSTPLWDKLGVRIGVLFVCRDLQRYCFKDGTGKEFVSLALKDIGLKPVLSRADVVRKAWETRRREGIKVNPLKEEHKRHIAESLAGRPAPNKGMPAWNKGLTKETDERVAKYSGKPAWNRGLTKETDPRVAQLAWNTGLTKETDKRVAQQAETLRRRMEFTDVR